MLGCSAINTYHSIPVATWEVSTSRTQFDGCFYNVNGVLERVLCPRAMIGSYAGWDLINQYPEQLAPRADLGPKFWSLVLWTLT